MGTSPLAGRARLFFGLGLVHGHLVFFCNGLACLYGCRVTADVADELIAQGVFNHAGMHTLDQLTTSKLIKSAAEGGFAR